MIRDPRLRPMSLSDQRSAKLHYERRESYMRGKLRYAKPQLRFVGRLESLTKGNCPYGSSSEQLDNGTAAKCAEPQSS